jgi:hypothetical protein
MVCCPPSLSTHMLQKWTGEQGTFGSSSDIPFRMSVIMNPWDEFTDMCLLLWTRREPRSLALMRASACFSLNTSTSNIPFFSQVTFLTLPAIPSRAFCT